MTPWHDDLTGIHRTIAEEPTTPLHVLAGPGTGKTFAMMRRIARLLEEGTDPDRILAVTFTRTAAKDLREQLQRLHSPGANNVIASTLHSLCFRLLNLADVFAHTLRHPRPLMSFEVRALELDLKQRFGGLKRVRRLLAAYEAAWARLQTEEPGGPSEALDADFHAAITDWLRYHRAMLVGELVPLTLRFIQQNPELRVIPRFEYVLVDEYQDLNRAEQDLIDRLAAHGTLTVIGDDCQSIYSFRHANPEGIRTFPLSHAGTLSLNIEECRRCPPNLVAMSNALISHEPRRTRATPLVADESRPPAHVVIVQHRTLADEVATLADYIAHFLRCHPDFPPGQVLVLTPRRFIGNEIRDELIARRLNAMSYFSEDPVQTRSAAQGFVLLSLLVDPADRPALRAWLAMGSSTGLAGGYRRLVDAAVAANSTPRDTLEALAAGRLSLPHTGPLVQRWNALRERLDAFAGLSGLELVRALWPDGDEDCDDIRLMAEAIAVHSEDPAQILEALRHEVVQPFLPDSSSDVIRVMSLHKSKGLTAALVVNAGCMAGALPRVDADLPVAEQEARLQEQRRLFYVAITRATHTLVISSSTLLLFSQAMRAQVQVVRQRRIGGEQFAVTAMTPFVGELGAACPAVISQDQWRAHDGF